MRLPLEKGIMRQPTLFLTVGLACTGKTTAARRIEIEQRALRLTKDEWVKALYGRENPPSAGDVIEGRLIQIGLRALELGNNVVIDYPAGSPSSGTLLTALINHEYQRRRSRRARFVVGKDLSMLRAHLRPLYPTHGSPDRALRAQVARAVAVRETSHGNANRPSLP